MTIEELINQSPSMDNEEKQGWLDRLPTVSEDQKDRLKQILETEKEKLDNFEKDYQEAILNLNEKIYGNKC